MAKRIPEEQRKLPDPINEVFCESTQEVAKGNFAIAAEEYSR
jgi:hypothetical protein